MHIPVSAKAATDRLFVLIALKKEELRPVEVQYQRELKEYEDFKESATQIKGGELVRFPKAVATNRQRLLQEKRHLCVLYEMAMYVKAKDPEADVLLSQRDFLLLGLGDNEQNDASE